jgi:hypothetical protein
MIRFDARARRGTFGRLRVRRLLTHLWTCAWNDAGRDARSRARGGRTNSQAPRVNHVEADIGSEGSLRLAYGELKYWTRPAPMLDSLDG